MITYHISGRQTGKTTRLIEWLKLYPDGVIIVVNYSQKRWLEGEAADHGMDIRENVFTYSDWVEKGKFLSHLHRPIAVDNLDLMLASIFGGHVEQITSTGNLYGKRAKR